MCFGVALAFIAASFNRVTRLGLLSKVAERVTFVLIPPLLLIFLVLLHSGKDAGLSGAFGIGGGGSSVGGGSMVERNLTRATVATAILFVLNTIVLLNL